MRKVRAHVYVREGDIRPYAELTLVDAEGERLDLSDVSAVVFSMARLTDGANVIDEATASVVGTPSNGDVRYAWASGQTDVPGDYIAEFAPVWPEGAEHREAVPGENAIIVRITEAIRVV